MKKFASLALAAATFAVLGAPAAHAAFSPEKRVSTVGLAGPSIQPNVAVSGSNVYVVWSENAPTGQSGDIYFARSLDSGDTFQPAILVAGGPRNDVLPIIAANGTQVHIFWTDDSAVGNAWHAGSTNSGASFSAPKILSPNGDNFYSRPSGAVVDGGGRVHFAYYDNRVDGTYGQVYYRCSADGGNTFTADVNLNLYDGTVDHELPRMTQGGDGTLYVLMRTNKIGFPQGGWGPTDQFLLRTDGAPTSCAPNWLRPPQRITVGMPEEFNVTYGAQIAAGSGDSLHAAWWGTKSGTNLYYRRGFPNGKGWETPIDLSGLGIAHAPWGPTSAEHSIFGIGDDGAGRVHAIFGANTGVTEGFETGQLYYTCSPNGGVSFNTKVPVTSTVLAAQPRGVAANGIFHMVWMDWRENNAGAEIWYRKATGGCSGGGVKAQDLNGDGRSDVLYRNFSTGQVFRAFANGLTLSSPSIVYQEGDTNWRIVGDGDFNGDGVADLLWHNIATGQVFLQPFNSSGVPAGGAIMYSSGAPATQWKIIGTPDINGDGKNDILWRNLQNGRLYVVLLNGLSVLAEGLAYVEGDLNWEVVGVGDTDADGKQNQIFYRNKTNGLVYLLTINHAGGSTFTNSGQLIYQEGDLNWRIQAIADFTGDGRSDMMWRNVVDGRVFISPISGNTVQGGAVVWQEGDANWEIVATGDYNGDGKADLLWRNKVSGQVYMMLVNGLSLGASGYVWNEPQTAWRILGPLEYSK